MQQTGAAVLNGVLSTLIAALCLSGSESYAFITFFYSLLFIVIFGAFQGLVVLPVLLAIFRPAYHADPAPSGAAPGLPRDHVSPEVQTQKSQHNLHLQHSLSLIHI